MPVIVHLIRHAETTANAAQAIAGWTDVPLTEHGTRQAARLRDLLERDIYDTVWSSDLRRAIDTAHLAGLDPTPDARMRELNFGDLEGADWQTVLDQYAGAFTDFGSFVAPNGESVAEMRARILDFVNDLQPGRHAVFCHGGVIRILLGELGEPRFVGNCTVVEVDWTTQTVLAERTTAPSTRSGG